MFLSKTAKGLKFYPASKLTSQPATVYYVLSEDTRCLGQRQIIFSVTAIAIGKLPTFIPIHWLGDTSVLAVFLFTKRPQA